MASFNHFMCLGTGEGPFEYGDAVTPRYDDLRRVRFGSAEFVPVPAPKEFCRGRGTPGNFTVFDVGARNVVSKNFLLELLGAFKACDTFHPSFLRGVFFSTSGNVHVSLEYDAHMVLRSGGTECTRTVFAIDYPKPPRPGPYLLTNGSLFELWRLRDDTHECFVSTFFHTRTPDKFRVVPFTGERLHTLAVAVPSCLQAHAPDRNLIAGLRIAVKDNFHLAGVKTSLCNRAYHDLYPPQPRTAACIQKLVDAGAVILGKTKLASFAATEEPIECVDYSAPWNPRADGYQSPAGSSSGSGAAVAAYEWIDIGIGSDTSGSGRRPGHWNGCIAMRPSHGVLPMDGQFDVATFFGRDLLKCRKFAEGWYGEGLPKAQDALPLSIVVPTEYLEIIGNQKQLELIEGFISELEGSFDIKRRALSLESCWAQSPPQEAQGLGLSDFMKDACRNSFWHDDFHSMADFRKEYEGEFGRKPYISPPVRWQWDIASRITETEREHAVVKLEVYRRWFAKEVMKNGELNTIVLLPVEEISPRYRDEPPARKFYPTGVPMLFLSPILRAPELTIPIGEIPYESKVTGCGEFLPVGVSLMASPGYDLHLMDLMLDALDKNNRPTSVTCGRRMFPE